MADQWQQLGPIINVDKLTALADSSKDVLSVLGTYLGGISTAIELIQSFVIEDTNVVRATIEASISTIENTIGDLLSSNLAFCLHWNLVWNPDWEVEQFENAGILPWVANGMEGWLLNVATSANNPTDPFRPVTGVDTHVGGFIFVTGQYAGQELGELANIFNAFTGFESFKQLFEIEVLLEQATEEMKALLRLGPAAADPFINQEVLVKNVIAGLEDLQEVMPVAGAYPKWISIPVAGIVPGIQDLFYILRQVSQNIQLLATQGNLISDLLGLLERRVELLEEAADRLSGIIDTIVGSIEFYNGAYVILLSPELGGFDNFIARARGAEGLPDFGGSGIVVGAVGIVTADDPFDHLEAFWDLLGLTFDDYIVEGTVRSERLSETYDEFFS